MKLSVKKIVSFAKSRLVRNIIFWLLIISQSAGCFTPHAYPMGWYWLFIAATTLLLMGLTYLNNLLLVPRFLAKREYAVYIPIAFTLVFGLSFAYTAVVKTALIHFPEMLPNQINPFPLKVTKDWGIAFSQETTFTMFYLLGWLFMFTMMWYLIDYSRKEKEIQESKKRQTEAELNFLKSQINPHFLFNTLNNLYALTIKKSDHAPEVVSKLSMILRYLLYESNVAEVPFEKEKEIMQAYIDLEMLRLTNKDNLHFTITTDKPHQLPPLLWVPVLENVFKHGTRLINDNQSVDYRFTIQDGRLTIFSKNSFKPHVENMERAGGIGLTNLKKRLALIFPGRHIISAQQEDNYYVTEVKINLSA